LEKPFTLTTTAAGVSRSTTPETILPNFGVSIGITLHGAKINAKRINLHIRKMTILDIQYKFKNILVFFLLKDDK
jgi:AraC-like DNA-binding protein